ncbi:MAG: helix-turn-helix domain-containing protein [Bacteroidales bacterium]|nr:helix-turn-helix domain-containing protein [Bacteroidales bacterium]
MDYKLITVAEYQHLLKELNRINETISEKIKSNKEIFCESDLSQLLSTSKRTLINWRQKGLISYSKVEGKIFYTRQNVEKFLEDNETSSIHAN